MCCREALQALMPEGALDTLPFALVLAVNKMDALPRYVSHKRVEDWVRRRAKQGGLPRPDAVHLVSSVRNMGIQKLSRELAELVRGHHPGILLICCMTDQPGCVLKH